MQVNRIRTALLAAVLLGAFTHTAYAGYTVIDDDLFPSSVVPLSRVETRRVEYMRAEPRIMQARVNAEQHYEVPFLKLRSQLIPAGRTQLDELLPEIEGAKVRIVGRADAMEYTGGKLESLPYNRANTIRTYLMRKGIAASNITIEVDGNPNPQPNGSLYPSDIYVSRPVRAQPTAETSALASQPKVQSIQLQPQRPATVAPTIADSTEAQTIQYINQSVQNGQMLAAVAVKLIEYILANKPASVAPALVRTVVTPPTASVQTPPPPLTWTLDQRLTLRDNIDAWSKGAGWNPSQWEASNLYQVTDTIPVTGNFPDVLRQIADSTGLNICARSREKVVRVTDASVSCK